MDGTARLFHWAEHYRQQTPVRMPRLEECKDMLDRHRLVLQSLTTMEDVLQTQEKSRANQQNHNRGYKNANDYDMEDSNGYADDLKTGGVGEGKKRRGVCCVRSLPRVGFANGHSREPLPQGDATAATVPRRPNGAADPTAQGRCVMLAGYVCSSEARLQFLPAQANATNRLCEADAQDESERWRRLLLPRQVHRPLLALIPCA